MTLLASLRLAPTVSRIRRFAVCLSLVSLAVAGSAAVAAADTGATRLVVSPKPGQAIGGDRVRIVVRAGAEGESLKARLNGVPIGKRFAVRVRERRRVLEASPADGLRRGRNVLRVWVAERGGYRPATVRFEVAHRRPLASAGIDRRVVAGRRFEVQGLLRLHRSDAGRKRLRWEVVKAPARSALSRSLRTGAKASAKPSALSGRRTLTPTLRPDVRGRYKIRLTAISGNGASSDTATLYAVPANPLVLLDTSVPATASEPRPGIQVGGDVLRAPYLRTAGKQGSYSGDADGIEYAAIWQVLAYDRVTMALKWNRTYGICNREASVYPCTADEGGNPKAADLGAELSALGPQSLVVAVSHPSGGAPGLGWAAPAAFGYLASLKEIGLPTPADAELAPQIAAAKAGEMAAVGVPGLAEGEAKFIVGGGRTGLRGYLTPDSNAPKRYFYLPGAREPFDSRFAGSCNAQGCTVAQKVGETVVNGTVGAGQAGFLVSGFDRHTLAPVEHQTFTTASGVNEGSVSLGSAETEKMAAYLQSLASRELLVFVTSVHGPSQSGAVFFTPGTPAGAWGRLTEAIAAIGGTREGFNSAATTAGSDYTLVGYAQLEEGAGDEIAGAAARLRGALVPSARSQFEPHAVTSGDAAPAELLIQILLRAPQPSAWPLQGNTEAQAAIAAIGAQSKQLGPNPRAAYWTQLTSPELAALALEEVERSRRPPNATFGAKAFGKAKEALETEIGYVKTTRTYMKELAQPASQAGKIGWQEAGLISAELTERLKQLKEEGQAKAEYLAIVEELLEIVSLGADVKEWAKTAKFLAGAAIAAEVGQTIWAGDYSGAAKTPGVTVQALQLGKQLRLQAEANEATFARMGDVIVSDWTKLREVGAYGGCNPSGGCGAYEELGHDEESEEVAAAAMKRSFDREIYERLVPLAFPIWNTGLTTNQEAAVPPGEFECSDVSRPFEGAPQAAYHRSLWQYDPVTGAKTWRVYLSVARSERTYGWAPEPMLKRMFEPVPVANSNAEEGGLGIDSGHFMRQGLKISEYVSGWVCEWRTGE